MGCLYKKYVPEHSGAQNLMFFKKYKKGIPSGKTTIVAMRKRVYPHRQRESKSERSLKKSPLKGRQQGRGKFIKKEKEYIQTRGSLFGEGIAASSLKHQNYAGGSKVGSVKDQSYIHKPVLNYDAAANVDKEVEEQKLREILRDDFIDDPEDDLDFRLYPIRLPMISTSKVFKDETQIKADVSSISKNLLAVRIKEEPVEGGDLSESLSTKPESLSTKPVQLQDKNKTSATGGPKSILPETNSNEFMFFQLPSCLPGHPPEVKQEPTHHNALPKKSTSVTNNMGCDTTSQNQCTLASLPEGRIGTIKIYESGKTEFWLGDHIMTIRKGTRVGFLQEIVKMAVDNEAKEGSITVLGHIKHRLVCIPDFDSMAKSKES